MAATIRLATVGDAVAVAAIYSHFVRNTPVSFESEAPDVAETERRISAILQQYPWLVCEAEGEVAGYCYASQHRVRHHYQWSVDVTVYVHEAHRRQGIGTALYTALLNVVPLQGYVCAYAGITLPNPGSVGLHEAMGFTPVGVYHDVGYKLGTWHDVGWWERRLQDLPADPAEPVPLREVLGAPRWNDGLQAGETLLRV